MNADEKEKLIVHIKTWKKTQKFLEKLEIEQSRKAKFEDILFTLSDASDLSLLKYPPKKYSGLIEMQRIFRKDKR